jgi:hypothetical protein
VKLLQKCKGTWPLSIYERNQYKIALCFALSLFYVLYLYSLQSLFLILVRLYFCFRVWLIFQTFLQEKKKKPTQFNLLSYVFLTYICNTNGSLICVDHQIYNVGVIFPVKLSMILSLVMSHWSWTVGDGLGRLWNEYE